MRTALKNKRSMKYALYSEKMPTYALDDDGNILTDTDGTPITTGYKAGYFEPIDFKANISFAGGEAEAVSYGVSVGDYDSKLLTLKNEFPISETSLIFTDSEPEYDASGNLKDKSADFRVFRVAPSLNYTIYLLKRVEK